jgi:glycine/D-amino acid oxidase-like deaminating enzyme
MDHDCIVIGGGLVGSAVAYGLSPSMVVTAPSGHPGVILAWSGSREKAGITHLMHNGA